MAAEEERDEVAAGDENGAAAPRAFWSGTITFGLVSIPVDLYPANRSQRVSLRMVTADGVPLTRRYFCPKEERELDWDEIVRGYEVEKDTYVVVTEEELEKLAPEKTRDIDLRRFVDSAEIDPIHFERAYFLTPGGNSTKAYRLLAATMEQTNRAGIATFVMRGKEYLVAILAENGILRAETLRFADEIRSPEDVGLPAPKKPKAADVKKIERAVGKLTRRSLAESELVDRGADRLLKLVAKKEKAGRDVVTPAEPAAAPPSEGVIDLMEVLKRSLQGRAPSKAVTAAGEQAAPKRTSAGKAAAKKSGTKKTATRSSAKQSAASSSRSDAADLAGKSKEELYDRAKQLDIPGRSGMSKQELIAALRRSA
jgi:DNA end-binding protein Ku